MKHCIMKNLNTITRCASLYRDALLLDSQITGYQAPYVPLICKTPGITQDFIAATLHVNPSTVTRQITLLEEKGFITRVRSETDKRVFEIYPTTKMLEIKPKVSQTLTNWRTELTSVISEHELEQLEFLISRLAKQAEKLCEDNI